MDSVNSSAGQDIDRFIVYNDFIFDDMSMSKKRPMKELSRPSVNPFEASSSGMYILPEEMTQSELTIDELMCWGYTDDEQIDTDDDEMDDNEYDTDFPESEYPPPLRTVGPCMRHLSQPNFSAMASSPYVPPHNSMYTSSSINPAFINRQSNDQMFKSDFSFDSAPMRYVDPSRLQLSKGNKFGGSTSQASDTYVNDRLTLDANTTDNSQVSTFDSKNLSVGLESADIGMDIDIYDISPTTPSISLQQTPTEDQTAIENQHKSQPAKSPPNDSQTVPQAASPLSPPPQAGPAAVHAKESDKTSTASPESPKVSSPCRLPSPEEERPRRKTAMRRKPTRGHNHIAHSGVHVCTMTFPGGEECGRSFTRPYDLARHQETLHAAVRKTYTCEACGANSKTFSRLDALSRHMRLKHP